MSVEAEEEGEGEPPIVTVELPSAHPSVDTGKEGVVFGEERSACRVT